MRIGIDMDDTICLTSEGIEVYEREYLKRTNLTKEELWNIKENRELFLHTCIGSIWEELELKPDVVYVLGKLKELGHELYIITARSNTYVDDVLKIITNYLSKNNIEVDGIIIDAGDKVDACINNNIELMIDDSRYVYEQLTNNMINTILFDDKRKNLDIRDRIDNWQQIFKYFRNKSKKIFRKY